MKGPWSKTFATSSNDDDPYDSLLMVPGPTIVDKKVRDVKMRFILPKEIGAVDIYDDVEDSLFLKFFS